MSALKEYIHTVPDFPQEGVVFRDISPLLRAQFPEVVTHLKGLFSEDEWKGIHCVAGIEARGFSLAAALAAVQGKNFIPIRKAGKLPGEVASIPYGLEYGSDMLEMQYGDESIVIVDDVLATGGTLAAAADLAVKTGHEVLALGVLVNLANLNNFSWNGQRARAVLRYD